MVKSPKTGRELEPAKGYRSPEWVTRLVDRLERMFGVDHGRHEDRGE